MLPLGLSRRGKTATLAVSLLLSLLAVTAMSVFPLWQLVLLLLLLAVAITYLLDRQFGDVLYAVAEEEEDDIFPFATVDDERPIAVAADQPTAEIEQETLTVLDDLSLQDTKRLMTPESENVTDADQEVFDTLDGLPAPSENDSDLLAAWTIQEDTYLSPLTFKEYETLTEPTLPEHDEELLDDEEIGFLEHRELFDDIIVTETTETDKENVASALETIERLDEDWLSEQVFDEPAEKNDGTVS